MLLEPTFPISAPDHLLDKFLNRGKAVRGEHSGDHPFLGKQTVPQRGGETGDVAMPALHVVPRAGVGGGPGLHELVEPLKRALPVGRKRVHRELLHRPGLVRRQRSLQ